MVRQYNITSEETIVKHGQRFKQIDHVMPNESQGFWIILGHSWKYVVFSSYKLHLYWLCHVGKKINDGIYNETKSWPLILRS